MAEGGPSILVVDASVALVGACSLLEQGGMVVELCTSEASALASARRTSLDAVVLDPALVSLSLVAGLRASQPRRFLPILVAGPVTGSSAKPEMEIDGFASEHTGLLEVLARFLSMRRRIDLMMAEVRSPGPRLLGGAAAISVVEFHGWLLDELRRAHRHDDPLAFLLIELDPGTSPPIAASRIDDAIDEALSRGGRATDTVARLVGGRFAALLPRTALAGALTVGERICTQVTALQPPTLSCSVGLALVSARANLTARQVWSMGEQALSRARELGGSRVSLAPIT